MKCPECGFDVAAGLRFCSKCGARMDGGGMANEPRPEKKEKNAGGGGPSWKVFIAVLILGALAYGGYAGYMWYTIRDRRARGIEAYNRAQFNNCIRNLSFVIKKDPNSSTTERLTLARCYFQNKQPGKALDQLEDAVVWDKDNPEIHALWARLLVDMNQSDKAVEHALAALEIEPENRAALMALGLARIELQEYDEAAADLERAVDGASKEELQIIYNAMGKAYEKKQDPVKAAQAYEHSVAAYSNQEDIRMKLGTLYFQMDNYRDCYKHADAAMMLYPPGSEDKVKANKLSNACLELLKDTELLVCVSQRRKLDKQFFSYYLEYHARDREIRAEEKEYYGKTGFLEDLRSSVFELKEDYADLECLVDDPEGNYELSRQTMRFLCERLAGTLTGLISFLEDPEDDTAELYHRSLTELEKSMKKAQGIWEREETFYEGQLDPILPRRNQEYLPEPTE